MKPNPFLSPSGLSDDPDMQYRIATRTDFKYYPTTISVGSLAAIAAMFFGLKSEPISLVGWLLFFLLATLLGGIGSGMLAFVLKPSRVNSYAICIVIGLINILVTLGVMFVLSIVFFTMPDFLDVLIVK